MLGSCQLNLFVSLLRIEVDEEIRKQVDELMRQELKNLKMVCTVRTLSLVSINSKTLTAVMKPGQSFARYERLK